MRADCVTYDEIQVGDKASFSKTISESDVYQFAGIIGDFNELHVNQVAAEKARAAAAAAEDAVLVETLMNEEPTQGGAADPVETEAVAADAPAAEAENAEAAPADAEKTSEELPHGDEN